MRTVKRGAVSRASKRQTRRATRKRPEVRATQTPKRTQVKRTAAVDLKRSRFDTSKSRLPGFTECACGLWVRDQYVHGVVAHGLSSGSPNARRIKREWQSVGGRRQKVDAELSGRPAGLRLADSSSPRPRRHRRGGSPPRSATTSGHRIVLLEKPPRQDPNGGICNLCVRTHAPILMVTTRDWGVLPLCRDCYAELRGARDRDMMDVALPGGAVDSNRARH